MLYSKIIAGIRKVTENGQGIRVPMEFDHPEYNHKAGDIVSNPRLELLIADGWTEYTPPTPEPTPQTEPSIDDIAHQLLKLQSIGSEVVALDDASALKLMSLFPAWVEQIDKTLNRNERYYYDNRLWRVVQSHTAQSDWTPDKTPALFTEVSVEEWPEWRRPIGSEDAYNTGDKVTFEEQHYISTIDGNVWSPTEYPQGWQLVND